MVYWTENDESEGSERVSHKGKEEGKEGDRERPYVFCLRENVSYIRYKGGKEDEDEILLKGERGRLKGNVCFISRRTKERVLLHKG